MPYRFTLGLSVLLLPAVAAGQELPDPASLFPSQEVTATIHAFESLPEVRELTARLQAAVQTDPEWWQEHVQKAEPGQPLPYDERMGMSEDEYELFLELAPQMTMIEIGTSQLQFEAVEGGMRIVSASDAPDLVGIVIRWVDDYVETPFGTATERSEIHQTNTDAPTGEWHGFQWRFEEGETLEEVTIASFAIGRLAESGRTLIYYEAKQVRGGLMTARADRIVTFDPR